MPKKALVFSGGGSRGAYEVGVIKALSELAITFDIVVGTSVGSINAAVYIQNSVDIAIKFWQNLAVEDILQKQAMNNKQIITHYLKECIINGGADCSPLEKTLKAVINEEQIRNSKIKFGLVTFKLNTLEAMECPIEEIPEGKLVDYILASSAVYPAFKQKTIEGVKFIDGGYHDNIPINLAVKMGAEEALVVDVKSPGRVQKSLLDKSKITYIKPYFDLGNILVFDKVIADKNIRLGYLDTLRKFNKFDGFAYTFKKGDSKSAFEKYKEKALPLYNILYDSKFSILKSLITKTLKREMNLKESSDYFTAAAEIAAEVLDIDYLEVYEFDTLNSKILEKFNSLTALTKKNREVTLTYIISNLSHDTKHKYVIYFYELIKEAISGGNYSKLWSKCALSPFEIIAAAYVYIINS